LSLRGTKPRYNDITAELIRSSFKTSELTRQGADDEKPGVAVVVIFCANVASCCIRRGRIGYRGQPNLIMPVTREQAYPIAHITTLLQQRDHLSSIDSRSSALNNNDGCMAQAMGNSGYMTHQQIVCKGNNNARGRIPL